jgi:uronate dehydrogenase
MGRYGRSWVASRDGSGNVRILVTGAAGAVGRLLTPLLRADYSLRLCDLRPMEPSCGEAVQGDLADPAFARRMVAGVDGVVHLAGLVASQVSFEDTLHGNYRALLSLLEACRHGNVRRFIFASSHHIIGLRPSNEVYGEAAVPAPDSFYGLSKAFGEAACAMYAYRFGISTLVVRIGNADPQVADGRRERLWISGRDLAQLVQIGMTAGALRYEIVYGVSNCPDAIFSNEAAKQLGYRPVDSAAECHGPAFRALRELGAEDGPDRVGGRFAADSLPDPFIRLI